eukprot:XP_008771109.1 PREDICTED: uncharacterized protein C10orf107 homolog isoform X3 [Rattus norvegicus]
MRASSRENVAGSSIGLTSWGPTTPGVTPAGSTTDSEKNIEFQENERILSPDILTTNQIIDLLGEEDVEKIQEKMGTFLNFKNLQTSLRDAILLDYYVAGFCWAKGMNFSIDQYSKFMTLLDMLLQNLQTLHMSLEDSIKWLGEVMAEIGPNHSQKNKNFHIFNVKEANAIIDYLKISLFQHYRLYEFLFYSAREEIVIGTEIDAGNVNAFMNDLHKRTRTPADLAEGMFCKSRAGVYLHSLTSDILTDRQPDQGTSPGVFQEKG